jgi:hypothetical protein
MLLEKQQAYTKEGNNQYLLSMSHSTVLKVTTVDPAQRTFSCPVTREKNSQHTRPPKQKDGYQSIQTQLYIKYKTVPKIVERG